MRFMMAALASLMLCGGAAAAAPSPPKADAVPTKWVKIANNSKVVLYPIFFIGARDTDEWMQSLFEVPRRQINTDRYASAKTYRSYLIEDQGIEPGTSIYVQVPFFSQLAVKPVGSKKDQYIDWWNGGRILFYDDKAQVEADYKSSDQTKVTPLTVGLEWCRTLNAAQTACKAPHALTVFAAPSGFPATDLSQLMEYTFADAITANGAPYPLVKNKVGYNISSVDQVYLPVAMEPLGNPTIPYIGTVVTLPVFRDSLDRFLVDYPGWPVYNPAIPGKPRVPGAYNVFAAAQDLTSAGETVEAMKSLYRQCNSKMPPDQTFVCTQYRKVVALFQANYDKYLTYACHKPAIKFDENSVIRKVYGWVPFNEGCGAGDNSLSKTFNDTRFKALLSIYEQDLEYSTTLPLFNPYVGLIHDAKYLDMAAYAFSVDDAIGFQSYVGTGLILAFGGSTGLDNKTPLNLKDRVTVTLGSPAQGKPKWGAFGLCSGKANYGQFENGFWSVAFFPTHYPCEFTATDTKDNLFQMVIQSGPRSDGGLKVTCPEGKVANPAWCASAQVVGPQQINTGPPD